MSDYLFVYGSLLPGEAGANNVSVVQQLLRLGPAYARGRLYDLGEYAGAILDAAADTEIAGEVFELPADPAVLAALDAYEGYDPAGPKDCLFVRLQTPVRLPDGRKINSWIYAYNRQPGRAPLIADGDYRKSRAA